MNPPFFALLVRWSVLALGVTIATKMIPGIHYDTLGTLIVVVLLLSLFNAVLKPVLVLFSLPFILLTLGLGMLIINALLFLLVARILHPAFTVDGFWDALGGSLIVSLTNMILTNLIGKKPRPPGPGVGGGGPGPSPSRKIKSDDVIDI